MPECVHLVVRHLCTRTRRPLSVRLSSMCAFVVFLVIVRPPSVRHMPIHVYLYPVRVVDVRLPLHGIGVRWCVDAVRLFGVCH